VKKTELKAYSRPLKSGIIAIKLKEDDELVDCVVTKTGDEIVLATAQGMAIRFHQSDARPMGRNTSGVKGINLGKGDHLVGMVVADPEATLFTACEHGYGKRTPFGPNAEEGASEAAPGEGEAPAEPGSAGASPSQAGEAEGEEGETTSGFRYRTQNRGGKGLRDIKTTERNGPVVSIVPVKDDDELMMMTARGKIQRVAVSDFNIIGRNTQGVRIMSLDEGDTLAAIVRVPPEEEDGEDVEIDATAESPSPPDEET
jgi:DNA gyrase subunit A